MKTSKLAVKMYFLHFLTGINLAAHPHGDQWEETTPLVISGGEEDNLATSSWVASVRSG
ncbi:MAG: hypothetical protein KatS3mg107_0800 [Gemmataceae bacterium]|nr:MAG: hypothetical protein KatS3mg107_0800 [Gemmataceae bacterium]